MNQSIDLTPQDAALIAGSLANDQARIERLIAKLSAPTAPHQTGRSASQTPCAAKAEWLWVGVGSPAPHWPSKDPHTFEPIPAPGQPWPSQGGIYAGALPALDGQGIEHLVLGDWIDGEFEWGSYGKDIPAASSLKDGKANTSAMLAAQSPAAIAVDKRNTSAGDFSDWQLPSQQETHLVAATCFDHMDQAVIWTSTQYSAYLAWFQSFNDGYSNWNGKDGSLRVRPVRRFKL